MVLRYWLKYGGPNRSWRPHKCSDLPLGGRLEPVLNQKLGKQRAQRAVKQQRKRFFRRSNGSLRKRPSRPVQPPLALPSLSFNQKKSARDASDQSQPKRGSS